MGKSDFLLYPIYLAILYFVFKARRKRYDDPILKFYHKQGFWIKALAVIPFAFFNWKISPGDSYVLYQVEGYNMYQLILKDPGTHFHLLYVSSKDFDETLLQDPFNLGYFKTASNFMIGRITAMMCFFSFGKYLINCLFFSMISFAGVWRIYRFFYNLYPHLHKQLAIAILYMPMFVFWSSGILKDPLCTGAIGWITYSLYDLFYRKKNLVVNIAICLLFGYLLAILKIYILVSYVPFFFLFLILKNVNLIKNRFAKAMFYPALIMFGVIMFTTVLSMLQDTLGAFAEEGVAKSIKTYQKAYADQSAYAESNFSLGVTFDGSMVSLVKMAPLAIIATLYRPYIWEARKISTLLSSLESLGIMLFTIWVLMKVGLRNFFLGIIKDPAALYCILFALLFALFVGATTLNFGTLVRYKIPCIPFYMVAIFLIKDRYDQLKNKKAMADNLIGG